MLGGTFEKNKINEKIKEYNNLISTADFWKDKFSAQKMLPISLSYDHRVINGADAARFTKLFGEIISKPSTLK